MVLWWLIVIFIDSSHSDFESACLFQFLPRIDTIVRGGSARLGIIDEDFGKYCMICRFNGGDFL